MLVVGDTIIDEYHFVRPYGMPMKAPIIASQFIDAEAYAGGILAVANHVAGFCDRVDVTTVLGLRDTREDLARAALRPNVRPTFFYRPDAPTTAKRRFLMRYLTQKLFEVAYYDDRPLDEALDTSLAGHLREVAPDYDLVIVVDYGHGMLSERSISVLCEHAPFLAVNAQLNSINYGYNVITKYQRANYVCLDEPELRIAMRDREAKVDELLATLSSKLGAAVATVTRGPGGSLTQRRDGLQVRVPILSRQVIDTVGAGDAYLAISAPCVRMEMPPELVGFIGNAVGGLAVRIVGNKEAVGPEALYPFIRTLLES